MYALRRTVAAVPGRANMHFNRDHLKSSQELGSEGTLQTTQERLTTNAGYLSTLLWPLKFYEGVSGTLRERHRSILI